VIESWNFGLGAVLVVWLACREFQSPYALGYVRDRTDFQRYIIGMAVFALGAWTMYVLIWILARRISADLNLLAGVVGFSVVIVTGIVFPMLPLTSAVVARFRGFTQRLAGFPNDADKLAASLRRPEIGCGGTAESFNAEIERFGFSLTQLKECVSPSCMESVLESQRVHDQLSRCRYANVGLVESGFLGHYGSQVRARRLSRYLIRRQEAVARVDGDYFLLLRRAARVVKLASDRPLSARQLRQLSAFLADQAEDLIARYQRLVAQTALAVFPPGKPRLRFLECFGYTVPNSLPSLPLWPIVTVLAIDILTSGSGFELINYISHGIDVDLRGSVPVIFAHGFAMTAAVFWAIAPKVMWVWTRPGLIGRSISSYALFGLASYLCGFVFFGAALWAFPLPPPPSGSQDMTFPGLVVLLLPAGLFAVTNVVLSWRIDRRIIESSYGHGRAALGDASSLIVATILFSGFFRTMSHFVFGMPWKALPAVWIIWPVLGVTALVIGFAIPGWAADYIYPSATDRNEESPRRHELVEEALADGTKARV
jgi:hypothetical protein